MIAIVQNATLTSWQEAINEAQEEYERGLEEAGEHQFCSDKLERYREESETMRKRGSSQRVVEISIL